MAYISNSNLFWASLVLSIVILLGDVLVGRILIGIQRFSMKILPRSEEESIKQLTVGYANKKKYSWRWLIVTTVAMTLLGLILCQTAAPPVWVYVFLLFFIIQTNFHLTPAKVAFHKLPNYVKIIWNVRKQPFVFGYYNYCFLCNGVIIGATLIYATVQATLQVHPFNLFELVVYLAIGLAELFLGLYFSLSFLHRLRLLVNALNKENPKYVIYWRRYLVARVINWGLLYIMLLIFLTSVPL